MAKRKLKIGIAGAGVAGLAAGSFLSREGHDVSVFDRFAEPRPVGAALLLQPTGLACLAKLGIDDEVVKDGAKITRLTGLTRERSTVLDLDIATVSKNIFSLGVHRGILFNALLKCAVKSGVKIVPNFPVESLKISNDALHIVSEENSVSESFDLVIDASGTHSKLRAPFAKGAKFKPYPYAALWAVVEDTQKTFDPARLQQRYDRGRKMCGVMPVNRDPSRPTRANMVGFFWSMKVADYDGWRMTPLETWKVEVRALFPEVATLLDSFQTHSDLTLARYADVTVPSPVCGRIVWIGDSSHATSPQLGQGANLALADAMMLAEKLNEDDIDTGLAKFTEVRRAPVAFYQAASRWLTPLFQSDLRVLPKFRDLFMGHSAKVPYVRRQMVFSLTGLKTGLFSHRDAGTWHSKYSLD